MPSPLKEIVEGTILKKGIQDPELLAFAVNSCFHSTVSAESLEILKKIARIRLFMPRCRWTKCLFENMCILTKI